MRTELNARCAVVLESSGYTIEYGGRRIMRQPFDPASSPPLPFASNAEALASAVSEALAMGLIDEAEATTAAAGGAVEPDPTPAGGGDGGEAG